MVESCSAVKCYNRRNKNEKMKFHRFPTDPNRRKLWLNAVRRVNFIPSKTTVICEKHFTSEDYELNVYGNRMLKKSAVPSVFEFHGHIKKEHKQQGILKRKQYEELTSEETEKILNITETEVIEAPENCSCADDGNILPAGPSNIARNPGVLQSSEPSSANRTNNFRPNNRLQVQIGQNFANICKRSKREPVYVGETEVIEAPENCSHAIDENILPAGSSNIAQNPEVLQSSEPSSTNICKREPVYVGETEVIEAPENCSLADYGNILSAGPSNRAQNPGVLQSSEPSSANRTNNFRPNNRLQVQIGQNFANICKRSKREPVYVRETEVIEAPENCSCAIDENILPAGSSNIAQNPRVLQSSEPSSTNICKREPVYVGETEVIEAPENCSHAIDENILPAGSSNIAQNPEVLQSSEPSSTNICKREPVYVGETEVIEAPENCSLADYGNILSAGPSNRAQNPGVLQSSEPSSANRTNNFRPNNRLQVQIGQNFANICKRSKREPVYVGETEVIEAPENCSCAIDENILLAGSSNIAQNPRVLQSSEPSSTNICKRPRREPVYVGETEVIEAPENCSHVDDGNILPAGPSNIAQNPGVLQSSEPSSTNICKRPRREPVYVGETEVIEAPENCSHVDDGNILPAGPSNIAQNPGVLQSSEPSSTNICKRSKRQPVYFGDFKLSDLDNTQFRMRFWKVAQETVDKYRKLIKYNQCQIRRQGKKIKSLKILLDELLKEKKISAAQSLVLKENLSETQKHLIFGHLKKGKSNEYSPELRCFALTLHSYSSSAYNYVRKMYGKTVLPHPRTLSKWHSVVDGTPAYSAEALLN
ncbi:uncharacterized protein LOC114338710 isoform X4 [Diabrotica virgifera virgifera]|uniref:THAP-type domain-containing protein n=1 Tax=Diabrotica virgifera virgifera TaxID=50390 RepID=A0ABM5JQ19_DIAVI|nr:uncharacterized protein LOC114338710 isoform X4 [Diabrotica virgifera virgifera]